MDDSEYTHIALSHVDRSINGRVALVTGATRGIGAGIANTLARAGAKVVCTGCNVSLGQKVSDIASAVNYLASDGARWITGTNLMVDGGLTSRA